MFGLKSIPLTKVSSAQINWPYNLISKSIYITNIWIFQWLWVWCGLMNVLNGIKQTFLGSIIYKLLLIIYGTLIYVYSIRYTEFLMSPLSYIEYYLTNTNILSKTSFWLESTTPTTNTNYYSYCRYKDLHRKRHPAEEFFISSVFAI